MCWGKWWVQELRTTMSNFTAGSGFLLLTFSEVRELQLLHFFVFLALYLTAVTGNLLIIMAVALDHHLHTPMYFFLMNLAVLDIGSISVAIPKSMMQSLLNSKWISFSGCAAQVFFYFFFAAANFSILTIMAHDRCVAICKPLHYERIMHKGACIQMAGSAWIAGMLYGILHTGGTFAINFCSNIVNQFFCEIPKLLILSCSDLYLVEVGFIAASCCAVLSCFIFMITTYIQIFMAVLKVPSARGQKKALSTCLPHLIVFSLFLLTSIFAYVVPPSNSSSEQGLIFAIIYITVPPTMNPVIYSMRNKEIKLALQKMLTVRHSSTTIP
ncbi:olfactory receptor 14A16-like [Hemicordylus capensis]|uniref:olfactory receptor 14A16-like n=1 Tax=Hemicordylus capensis TaxID=884348 RepID=UPI002304B27B|nr:olfactory receptor 14A16-like [Hemicordylus capensis]